MTPLERGDGGDITDAVVPEYASVRARRYWDQLEPAVTEAVTLAARTLGRSARSLYPPAAAFALWAWQTRGVPAQTKLMFRRRLVEEFVQLGMPDFSRSSRATYRSALLAIADAVTPAYEKTLPIPSTRRRSTSTR